MAAANDSPFPAGPPETPVPFQSGAMQASPVAAAEEKPIPLPPLTYPHLSEATPEQIATEITRLDRGIVGLVLVLAFLLASFAVRNSDFWMHLATGRLLAQGQYAFGVDPFSYTTTHYWANHAWLFDLVLYALVSLGGGPESGASGIIVVLVKAVLVTGLAWVMLQTRRRDQSLWLPGVCTGLAVIALSPRLLLQPTVCSLLLLALTLYLLQVPRWRIDSQPQQGPEGRSPLHAYWLLPPLFALWVNLDSWFILGPLTVVLFLLGQLVQQWLAPIRTGAEAPLPKQYRTLLLVFFAGLAACLVNPHHYHALRLPAQISPATPFAVLEQDSLLSQLFYSQLHEDYYHQTGVFTVAGVAYYLLVLVGLGSFVLNVFAGWRWWRFAVWLGVALLSAYQARVIPFFAVVAGPITALNLQDFAAIHFGKETHRERWWTAWSLGGRILTFVAGVVLVILAWPGWLHLSSSGGRPFHRVAWDIVIDPSLRQTAEQLRAWRSAGLIQPDERGFHYSPEFGYYCAWFCPEEKSFFDMRFEPFSKEVTTAYVDIRRAFLNKTVPISDSNPGQKSWQRIFHDDQISYIVLTNVDPASGSWNAGHIGGPLLSDWDQWALIYLDGRTAIYRWNPAALGTAQIPRLDPNPFVFGPNPDLAPSEGPGRPPQRPDLWARFLQGLPNRPLDSDKAGRYVEYFDQISGRWPGPAFWTSTVLAPVALFQTSSALGSVAVSGNFILQQYFPRFQDLGPPGAPLLSIRAARRAIAESPDDPQAYVNLAEAYIRLKNQEDLWTGKRPNLDVPRQGLRQMQIVTAFEHHLKLRPGELASHLRLFDVYYQMDNLDKAAEHLEAAIRAATASVARQREDSERRKMIESLQKDLDTLNAEIKERGEKFDVGATDLPLREKVQTLVRFGLKKRALDLLLQADSAQIDRQEAVMQLDLLLALGQPEVVRQRFQEVEGLQAVLRAANYERLSLLLMELGGVTGNYREAGEYLDEVIGKQEKEQAQSALLFCQRQPYWGAIDPGGIAFLWNESQVLAELRVIRGSLSLEEGDPAAAAKFFQRALDSGGGQSFDFASRPVAVRYLQLIKQFGGDR